jgi:hypothetical protein
MSLPVLVATGETRAIVGRVFQLHSDRCLAFLRELGHRLRRGVYRKQQCRWRLRRRLRLRESRVRRIGWRSIGFRRCSRIGCRKRWGKFGPRRSFWDSRCLGSSGSRGRWRRRGLLGRSRSRGRWRRRGLLGRSRDQRRIVGSPGRCGTRRELPASKHGRLLRSELPKVHGAGRSQRSNVQRGPVRHFLSKSGRQVQ